MATRKQSQWQGSPLQGQRPAHSSLSRRAQRDLELSDFILCDQTPVTSASAFCKTLVWTMDYYYTENTLLHAKNFIYVMETFKQ